MLNVLNYVAQEKKTRWGDARLVTGHNCVPQSSFIEMRTTKNRFRKTDGRLFYHFVQSFSADDNVTPQEVNAIGLEFAQRQFPDFEVVIATHVDTNHLHNHFVVNSVSCKDGHKLHQSPDDLLTHRKVNDEICLAYGLHVLDECGLRSKQKRMNPGEYQAGLRGDSWKLDLIQAINEALEYAVDRESFIENMEVEGYEVSWSLNRKHITFTCPNGCKCRDSSLHRDPGAELSHCVRLLHKISPIGVLKAVGRRFRRCGSAAQPVSSVSTRVRRFVAVLHRLIGTCHLPAIGRDVGPLCAHCGEVRIAPVFTKKKPLKELLLF